MHTLHLYMQTRLLTTVFVSYILFCCYKDFRSHLTSIDVANVRNRNKGGARRCLTEARVSSFNGEKSYIIVT